MQIQIYSIIIFETNTKTNIFRLTKKGKYNHKYIWVEEKRHILTGVGILGL